MISYSEIGGHVLTPFLDTYPGSVECGSARQGNGYWSAEELPIRVVADPPQWIFRLIWPASWISPTDSVAFALSSCLGGAPAGFHVNYQSDRHYRFSVANKKVGLHIYQIRRFIAEHFDVYFHLWRDGAPNWEREKRLWEQEQLKEWHFVMSKAEKRKSKSSKKVTFAPVPMRSPVRSSRRSPVRSSCSTSLQFGQFLVPVSATSTFDSALVFGSSPCSSRASGNSYSKFSGVS